MSSRQAHFPCYRVARVVLGGAWRAGRGEDSLSVRGVLRITIEDPTPTVQQTDAPTVVNVFVPQVNMAASRTFSGYRRSVP